MDFRFALSSDSIKVRSEAALFLRSERASGYVHLPMLLQRMQDTDLAKDVLSKDEIELVGCGALSIGSILEAVEYDETNSMHNRLVDYVVELVSSKHNDIAAYALNSLGELSPPPKMAVGLYEFVIQSGLRHNEHPVVTIRAIAFRMLAKADSYIARKYIDYDACREYILALDYWQVDCSLQSRNSLRQESDWIRQARAIKRKEK